MDLLGPATDCSACGMHHVVLTSFRHNTNGEKITSYVLNKFYMEQSVRSRVNTAERQNRYSIHC